jgi:Zn-dependent protease
MTDAPTQVRGIKLGSIKGAQIVVQPSTLLMLVLLAWLYSSSAGELTPNAFSLGMLLAVLLFVSVFLHELAHAIAAWAYGRKVHTIVLTLWGGHTTFDARNLTPGVVGVTAIAGPVANALIAIGASLLLQTGLVTGLVSGVVQWLVWANILLAIFNALPGIPMDGGKVLQSAVWAATGDRLKGLRIAGWAGRVVAVLVVIFTIGYPIAQGRGVDLINVAFAVLLFSVIWPSASAAIKAVDTQARRGAAKVGAIMRGAVGVPYTSSVASARGEALAAGVLDVVILSADGAPAAFASVPTMDRVPEEQREQESLQSVSVPMPRGAVVSPRLEGEELVTRLREWYGRTDSWAVVDGDRVVGVVRLEEVLAALQ